MGMGIWVGTRIGLGFAEVAATWQILLKNLTELAFGVNRNKLKSINAKLGKKLI